jgi:hypothetical protein
MKQILFKASQTLRDYSIHRVTEYLSLRRNWVPHPPPLRVCLPPWPKEGGGGPGGATHTQVSGRRQYKYLCALCSALTCLCIVCLCTVWDIYSKDNIL